MPQTCSTFAAYICGAFAANAFFVCKLLFWRTVLTHNVRRKYAVHSCRALFWHTMCATSLQRTVAAHCTGTQCAPQVCGAQLSRTILAHNVRRTGKFAAHSCRALYWHTMCAASMQRTVVAHFFWHTMCAVQVSLQRTVVAHYSCVPQLCGAQLPCTALFCPLPPPPPPTPPLVYHPHRHIFFSSLPPGGV